MHFLFRPSIQKNLQPNTTGQIYLMDEKCWIHSFLEKKNPSLCKAWRKKIQKKTKTSFFFIPTVILFKVFFFSTGSLGSYDISHEIFDEIYVNNVGKKNRKPIPFAFYLNTHDWWYYKKTVCFALKWKLY